MPRRLEADREQLLLILPEAHRDAEHGDYVPSDTMVAKAGVKRLAAPAFV